MVTKYKNHIMLSVCFLLLLALSLFSCTKYVDVGSPVTMLTQDKVFIDSATTLSSVLSLYSVVNTKNYIKYLNDYGSMSADDGYYFNNASYDVFRTNTLSGEDGSGLFKFSYMNVYIANFNLEGLATSTSLSKKFNNQMTGECKFWRAYLYFNLLNYYGAVPLVTTTDVMTNAKMARTDTATVYKQIVADLLDAKAKLKTSYSSYAITEKARVNKYVVSALLARVYLYRGQWAAAEAEADTVINSAIYSLETTFNNVFIKTSKEVIWQDALAYSATGIGVTQMGVAWIPSGTTPMFVLYDTLVNTFEANDLRKTNWTKSITYLGKTYYYPYKYKIRVSSAAGNEYNVMFRLAEQYLIRAEARAQQNKITGASSAAEDLNTIRKRAGLGNTGATDKNTMLLAIEKERWTELFTELSDRWLNLKRTKRIDAIFSKETEKKSTWQSFQALYSIPISEITINPNLLPNNPGY